MPHRSERRSAVDVGSTIPTSVPSVLTTAGAHLGIEHQVDDFGDVGFEIDRYDVGAHDARNGSVERRLHGTEVFGSDDLGERESTKSRSLSIPTSVPSSSTTGRWSASRVGASVRVPDFAHHRNGDRIFGHEVVGGIIVATSPPSYFVRRGWFVRSGFPIEPHLKSPWALVKNPPSMAHSFRRGNRSQAGGSHDDDSEVHDEPVNAGRVPKNGPSLPDG